MFYRVGIIKCQPGKADNVIEYLKSKEDFFSDTSGLISLSYFKSEPDVVTGIAVWKSKEILNDNVERVQSIMAGLTDFVTGPPEISEGDVEYQYNKK
ncbi:MAG: hypothetical protein ACJZ19_00195 [Candidatus Neomarinimicrobiota bacterium]|tara:strand:- start:1784 stop:2074 length:291 start_codon:yes stop_codon:yes gene_type:complete